MKGYCLKDNLKSKKLEFRFGNFISIELLTQIKQRPSANKIFPLGRRIEREDRRVK